MTGKEGTAYKVERCTCGAGRWVLRVYNQTDYGLVACRCNLCFHFPTRALARRAKRLEDEYSRGWRRLREILAFYSTVPGPIVGDPETNIEFVSVSPKGTGSIVLGGDGRLARTRKRLAAVLAAFKWASVRPKEGNDVGARGET